MSWLDDYVNQHNEFEAPQSFYLWGGLAAISAVVKDNIWLDAAGLYNVYPNIYVMLHADSGLKKSSAVNSARKLVTESIGSDSIITGRSSIQGILKKMGTSESAPGGVIKHNSAVFICSSELTSSLVDDPVAAMILTDLYDRNYNDENWKSLLKMEQFSVGKPVVSMLTATTEASSSEFFEKSAIKGGYFARTFVIHESKRNRPNALLVPPKFKIDYKSSADYLRRLSKLRGGFKSLGSRTHTEDTPYKAYDKHANESFYYTKAGIVYQEWYYDFLETMDAQEVKDDTGTTNRFGDSVKKVALLLSLAKSDVLELTEETMYDAIKMCERLIGNVKKVTMGRNGTSSSAMIKGMIIFTLLERPEHKISRQMLMKKMMYHYSTEDEFNDIINSLHSAGSLMIEAYGNTMVYKMNDEQVKSHMNLLDGKRRQVK